MIPSENRLRRHRDYQRVYAARRKNFGKLLTYFYLARGADGDQVASGPRIGLTVGRVMGNAVRRNRIKRRVREAVRKQIGILTGSVDVVLHPGRRVLEAEFSALEKDLAAIFRAIQGPSNPGSGGPTIRECL